MSDDNIIQKYKYIVSRLPVSKPLKQRLESLANQYNEDDSNSLQMLIIGTHDLLTKNNTSSSKSNITTETSALLKSTSETLSEMTNQQLLNELFDELDILLAEIVSNDDDLSKFEIIKEKLRQLFINLQKQIHTQEKQIHTLEKQIHGLESRVSSLEQFESDDNIIKMRNIALQLRNKLVRFIKPNLSYRAARDEYVSSLQTEERYHQLTSFIQAHDAELSISDLSRQIKTLSNARVSKAHKELPMSESDIDTALYDYAAESDEYSKQAANTVVRFLKLLSEHLNEPLIVSLA